MAKPPGPIRRAWYEWKMLRFPWRKRWLVGFDLEGNTFWEFKDALHAMRNRRIAKYARSTHFGDVNVSPAWMQWLRHTRPNPPTVAEQQQDLRRRETIKLLAARADQRWAEKPSALDAPDKQQPIQVLESRDHKAGIVQSNAHVGREDARLRERAVPLRPAEQQQQPMATPDVQRDVSTPSRAQAPPVQKQTPTPTPTQAQAQAQPAPAKTQPKSAEAQAPPPPKQPEPPAVPMKKFKKNKPRKDPKDSPWNKASQVNPGDDWQPKGWSPAPAARRRS